MKRRKSRLLVWKPLPLTKRNPSPKEGALGGATASEIQVPELTTAGCCSLLQHLIRMHFYFLPLSLPVSLYEEYRVRFFEKFIMGIL